MAMKPWGIRRKGTVRATKFFPLLRDAKKQLKKMSNDYEICRFSKTKHARGAMMIDSWVAHRR